MGSTNPAIRLAVAAALLSACICTNAHAQWTVFSLHSPDLIETVSVAVSGTQQVGVSISNAYHACLWTGAPDTRIDLNPANSDYSLAYGVGGGQQVGMATIYGLGDRASLWTGSAASWVDLSPAGSIRSFAHATSGTQQVGAAAFVNADHAGLWTGTAASWVDLNPPDALGSFAFSTDGAQQVGQAYLDTTHAILWTGTAASWVDLHPSAATESVAYAVSAGRQVGQAHVGGHDHASLWSGSAASWVDLNPVGATDSFAYAIDGDWVAGEAVFAGQYHAILWNAPSGAWEDLSLALTGSWGNSYARGVWTDGTTLYVTGFGGHTDLNRTEALLWVGQIPAPGAAALAAFCSAFVLQQRSRRCGKAPFLRRSW